MLGVVGLSKTETLCELACRITNTSAQLNKAKKDADGWGRKRNSLVQIVKFGVLRFKSTRIGETDGKQEDNYRIV